MTGHCNYFPLKFFLRTKKVIIILIGRPIMHYKFNASPTSLSLYLYLMDHLEEKFIPLDHSIFTPFYSFPNIYAKKINLNLWI